MFITLEGGEGAGKSTQAARLTQRLRAEGHCARQTHEPGGTPLADAIRALLLHPDASLSALAAGGLSPAEQTTEPILPVTEVLLLSAARAQHVERIREWLRNGEFVVCDRYADATRAYQGGGRGLDPAIIATAEALATGGLRPDLTLLFDLPVAVGQQRKRAAAESAEARSGADHAGEWNRLDAEATEFHERVRQAYLALAAQEPERWVVLDATLLPDTLADQVWVAVSDALARRRA
jgi:dTMP kinase